MNNQDTVSINKFLNNYRSVRVEAIQYAELEKFDPYNYTTSFESESYFKTRIVEKYSFEIIDRELLDLANIVNQNNREKELIRRYPALKKAYEQYKLMLTLIESEEQYYGRK